MERLSKNKIKTLPKEVLDLFPIWEYQCPKCGAYLGYEPVEYCVKCGARFKPEQARVPPRFLKSYKAMSEFAHKVLAPKLTEKQRELLFKYFTTIFSDGFESGDFSAWDGEIESQGNSISVSTSQAYQGSYSAYVSLAGDASSGGRAYVYKNLGATYSDIYQRIYLRITEAPATDKRVQAFALGGSSTTDSVTVGFKNDAGTLKLWEGDQDNWAGVVGSELQLDTWYCVEVHFTTSSVTVYLDGVEDITRTGLSLVAVQYAKAGEVYDNANSGTAKFYVDCVVVADTYIGPISEATTYTKTWQADTLFKKLVGISKIFTVDSALRKKIQTFKSIDSLFKKPRVLKQFGINTEFLERNVTKSFSVDSRLGAVTTHTIQKYTDALLQKSDITKMFNADVYLKKSREAQAQINTLFLKTSTVQKNFDVSLQKTETKTLSLDVWFGTAAPTAHTKIFGVKTMFCYRVELPTPLGITLDGQLVIRLKREVWVGNKS